MKAINYLSRIASYIAMVTVGVIMMLTVTDVFMRYVFARPLTGSTEMIEFMMVILIVGIVPCAIENKHIRVDILMERLTPKGQALLDAITIFVGSWLVVILGWRAFTACFFMIRNDVRSPTLDVPIYPFYVIMAMGFIFLFFSMIVIFVQKVMEVFRA
jgi:TRAP-type C4-dicarboxylate transport system permease small subunit